MQYMEITRHRGVDLKSIPKSKMGENLCKNREKFF